MSAFEPSVSVVIATKNRDDSVTQTVDSILSNTHTRFEIVVIDQSTNDNCKKSMEKYIQEPRVSYHQTRTSGLARARNLGVEKARSNLIAITDDDCIVAKNWLREIQKIFMDFPNVAIIFGNVLPAEYDASSGFIPCYLREQTKIISRVLDKNDVDGLGACMALRKSVWSECHGFDAMLGVGGELHSSSEGDLVLHALHQGHQVCETPLVVVTHHGFRTWQEGSQLVYRYWHGTGAMYGKHLKLYPVHTFAILMLLAWRWAFGRSRVAASLGPKTQKIYRLRCFISGLLKGLSLDIEVKTGHFRDTNTGLNISI